MSQAVEGLSQVRTFDKPTTVGHSQQKLTLVLGGPNLVLGKVKQGKNVIFEDNNKHIN